RTGQPTERIHNLSKAVAERSPRMVTDVFQSLFPEPLVYQRFVVLACLQLLILLRAQRRQCNSLTAIDAVLRVAAEGVRIVAQPQEEAGLGAKRNRSRDLVCSDQPRCNGHSHTRTDNGDQEPPS